MIAIEFSQSNHSFICGRPIRGRVRWSDLQKPLESLEVRLIWYTQGKGDRDLAVVDQMEFPTSAPDGEVTFEFIAPGKPYSFSGKLISLIWAIEAIAFPSRESETVDLVISLSGTEVRLGATEKSS